SQSPVPCPGGKGGGGHTSAVIRDSQSDLFTVPCQGEAAAVGLGVFLHIGAQLPCKAKNSVAVGLRQEGGLLAVHLKLTAGRREGPLDVLHGKPQVLPGREG